MPEKSLTFDQVFKIWIDAEIGQVEGVDVLPVARSKGFTSITEWRLASALRMKLDAREWMLEEIVDPNETIPNVIIGPYQGWSLHFENKIDTSFASALQNETFVNWVKGNERIMRIADNFPATTTFIVFRKPDGTLIHIEGGHRMCALAYQKHIGAPIDFSNRTVFAAIASLHDSELPLLQEFLRVGTNKQ